MLDIASQMNQERFEDLISFEIMNRLKAVGIIYVLSSLLYHGTKIIRLGYDIPLCFFHELLMYLRRHGVAFLSN